MPTTDWIPSREQNLIDLMARWKETVLDIDHQRDYNWTAADCAELVHLMQAFITARAAYINVNSTENRIAKDDAKDKAVDGMRDFANANVRYNKLVPDSVREFLGVGTRDTVMTSHDAPASQPVLEVRMTRNHFEHKLCALNAEGRASKPPDAYGVRYAWQIGGERPGSGEDLGKARFSRAASLVVHFSEADKGRPVYYAAAYENSKGDPGPWSPLEESIIA